LHRDLALVSWQLAAWLKSTGERLKHTPGHQAEVCECVRVAQRGPAGGQKKIRDKRVNLPTQMDKLDLLMKDSAKRSPLRKHPLGLATPPRTLAQTNTHAPFVCSAVSTLEAMKQNVVIILM